MIGSRNPDGSANLSGLNLPVERVAAACGHLDALAKAAKHAGDPRPLDHIRADLFLGMTDGTYTGLDDTAILDHLRTTRGNEEGADDEAGGPDNDGTEDDGPESSGPDGDGGAEGTGSAADELGLRGTAGTGMELRVRLSTLLGRDQHPAELTGWGPVHAELARELATTLGGAQWRFAITDAHGQLLHCGITRARLTGAPTRTVSCRAIVELQIPATTLRDLASDPARWAAGDPSSPISPTSTGTGMFRWTSRLGHSSHRPPPHLLEPLPDPLARNRFPIPLLFPVDVDWEGSQIWVEPPEPEAEPEPPPEPNYSDDILPLWERLATVVRRGLLPLGEPSAPVGRPRQLTHGQMMAHLSRVRRSPMVAHWSVCPVRPLTSAAHLYARMPGWSGVERDLDLCRHRGGAVGRADRGPIVNSPPTDQHRREAREAGGGPPGASPLSG